MQTPYTYGPAMLTSLERVAFYLNKDIGLGRVNGRNDDTPAQRRTRQVILQWILDVSAMFQYHCRREFLIQPRVQYFDNHLPNPVFFPSAVPILSMTSLDWDFLGTWQEGAENVLDSTLYRIDADARSFSLLYGGYYGYNALRVSYLGGLAYHGTQSVVTLEDVESPLNIVPGRYVYGMMSESVGRVVAYDSGTEESTIECLAGSFRTGEALTFQPSRDAQDIPDTGATIASVDRQSLCEAHPDIARALDIEARYLEKHETDFENRTDASAESGASRRSPRSADQGPPGMQEETQARLAPYVRYLVGS